MFLRQLLYRTETRLLPVIAGYWTVLPVKTNYEEIIRLLCEKMPDPGIMRKVLKGPYGSEMSSALRHLADHGGSETVDSFEESFGTLRVAGIDKVLREKYWKNPTSVTEMLYYRGMIYRHNRFVSEDVKECYIIPDDLLKVILQVIQPDGKTFESNSQTLIVRPAVPAETVSVQPIDDSLPETVSLAAALKRMGRPLTLPGTDISDEYDNFIEMLLGESGMFPSGGEADSSVIRDFLTSNRTAAVLKMAACWRGSTLYDELRENKSDLNISESPVFDKRIPRNTVLQILSQLQADTWWSLNGFITAVKSSAPDFLRGSFERERWIIYDSEGNDLSGKGSWFQLEGAYLRFLIFGPLQWLGIVQTAYADNDQTEPSAFRVTKDGLFFILESNSTELSKEISEKPNIEKTVPHISADGAVFCGRGTSRYFLYMAARFLEIEKFKDSACSFRMTPKSLNEAEKNGLSRDSLLSMLQRFSKNSVPPSLERMLSDPKGYNLPATIYNATILTIPSPDLLEEIINNNRLSKWIIQQINQNSLVIDPKGIAEIRRFLMEKEILVDIRI